MTGPPRIAVVGAGLIGQRHAKLVAQHAKLDALVDPNPNTADFAADLGVPHFADLEACLERGRADGLIIATPNQLHATLALQCIAEGKPVLIEKPITDKTETARHLVEAADAAGVPLLVGHHRRHNPLVAAAKASIDGGDIGRIVAVHAQFWLYKPEEYFAEAWRRQEGAGPVFINLIHDIDLLLHLCGDVVSVEARQSSIARGFEIEDTAAILLEFANGALGTVSVSDAIVAPWSWEFASGENPRYPKTDGPCYMLGGSHGSLSIPDLRLWSQEARDWWQPIDVRSLDYEASDPLIRQIAHFGDVIRGDALPLVSGRDGLRTLRVVEAIKRAAISGVRQSPMGL